MNYNISLIPGDGIGPENRCRSKKKFWTKYVRNMDILFLF